MSKDGATSKIDYPRKKTYAAYSKRTGINVTSTPVL